MDIVDPPVTTTSVFQLCPYRMKPYHKQPCSAEAAVGTVLWFLGTDCVVQTRWRSSNGFCCWRKIEKKTILQNPIWQCLNVALFWVWYRFELIKLLGNFCNVMESRGCFGAGALSMFIEGKRQERSNNMIWIAMVMKKYKHYNCWVNVNRQHCLLVMVKE